MPRLSEYDMQYMKAIWSDLGAYRATCESCLELQAKGIDDRCDYYCDSGGVGRPKDFAKFREATSHLEGRWQHLTDYLESEPKAWLEYD
jgi:hypothetical protein